MDAMERQLAHEQYNPPVVGVGDIVLFKRRHRNVWAMGSVYPPQSVNWKPGDPVGKKIAILVTEPGRSSYIAEDCYHIGDPKYVHDPNNQLSCWMQIGNVTDSDMISVYNEVLGRLGAIEAENAERAKIIDVLRTEIATLSARVNNPKSTMPPARQQQQKTAAVPQEAA